MILLHRKLHVHVQRLARKGVVHHLALLHQPAVPQIQQLISKRLQRLVAEHRCQLRVQRLLVCRAKQVQRGAIDVHDTDFMQALFDEFRMHLQKGLQVRDAALAQVVKQAFDGAEILDPE